MRKGVRGGCERERERAQGNLASHELKNNGQHESDTQDNTEGDDEGGLVCGGG